MTRTRRRRRARTRTTRDRTVLRTARRRTRRARRALRGAGASSLLWVSHRAAAMAQKGPLALRAGRSSSTRPRLAQHWHKPHASSFAPKRRARDRILHRHINWENRSAEGRMPSDPVLHALSVHKAKPPCLQAGRLGPASRQALERLAPKLLQALLHAEPPGLLFYRGKRRWASSSEKRSKAEPRASLTKRLCKQL